MEWVWFELDCVFQVSYNTFSLCNYTVRDIIIEVHSGKEWTI